MPSFPRIRQVPLTSHTLMSDLTNTIVANSSPSLPTADTDALQGNITITCFEHQVPPFAVAALESLYQNLHASLLHHEIRRKAQHASTYIVRKEDRIAVILLFNRSGNKVSVINEMIDLPGEELDRFSRFIFARYDAVRAISFSLIGKNIRPLRLPHHQYDGSEDIVLTLPASPDAYLEALSPKMRRNIRYCLRMIVRDNPTFHHVSAFGDDINDAYIHDLIHLKKKNIEAKKLHFGISDHELDWLVREAKSFTQLTVVTIDGKVCGGAINLRVKDHFFGQIICYDPAYKKYSLGILCTYLTICDQIERGGMESHLCWGRYPYKYKLRGVQRDRASLDIYRSHYVYWQNGGVILFRTIRTVLHNAKKRLLDMERGESKADRAGATVVRVLRKIKRLLRVP
jgi:hypothetical protein